MTTSLYLIRHGATSANEEYPYRLQGRLSDRPLSSLGIAQANATQHALAEIPLTAVYSSPLTRAYQTAEIIAHSLALKPVAIDELSEADIGRWEGLTWEEARLQDPEEHDRFHKHPGTVAYPAGESFLDVQSRALPALARLAAANRGQSFAVVAHNIVNRAVIAGLLGLHIDLARNLRQSNGGINLIEYVDDLAVVVMINSRLHIKKTAR